MAERSNSTGHVIVACKIPNGIHLELFSDTKPADMGSPAAFMPPPPGARFTLRGANAVKNDLTMRGLAQREFRYATTPVPRDFWDQWYARNKNTNLVVNGFIFALDNERDAQAAGKEREAEKTGLEPLNPTVELDDRLNKTVLPGEKLLVSTDQERLESLNRENGKSKPWDREPS